MSGATQVRRAFRGGRRIVDGARGLGVRVTGSWLLARGRAPATGDNTSFTWAHADADGTTIVWVHNYWSDAYGIDRPTIDAELVDRHGHTVARSTITLEPDASTAFDVRALCTDHAVLLPFDGQLLLRCVHDGLVAGRPVQVFGEYQRDDGESSGVHGQYGLMANPAAQVVSAMRVAVDATHRTGFVVTNAYAGPGAPAPMRAELTLIANDGRRRTARLAPIAPRGTDVVYADDVFPDAASFLGDRAGHARVKLPCPSSRVATFIEVRHRDEVVVNHGTVDRVYDQEAGMPASWTSTWPVASVLGIVGPDHDTVLTLPNVWGPKPSAYDAVVDLFRADGTLVASHTERIARDAVVELSLGELAADGGVTTGPLHAEVRIAPPDPSAERPHTFDVLAGFRSGGRLRAEVQIGADFYNAEVPPGVRWPQIPRTRIFGRVRTDADARTHVVLTHPVSTTGRAEVARPQVTLVSADGLRRRAVELELAPHGCVATDVATLFPDADEILGGTPHGAVRVRDTGARLYGFYWVERPGAFTMPLCHLIGG